ncbi:MAG: hypothetical protein OER96_02615, partial [Gammaproteobacteria bacterium]|nr:hypothetical protein [Gammaproteobacteria bacterium]
IKWDSAWTVVPGLVHISNLRLRNQTRRVQSFIEVDKVTALCALTPFIQRTFRTHWLRASGVAVKVRPRPDDLQSVESIQAYFPAIPGLDLTPAAEMPRPEMKRPWRIQLDGIHAAAIRDIWFANVRLTGDANASGSANIVTRAEVAVPIANGEFAFEKTMINDTIVARHLNGNFETSMEPFVPRQNPGLAVFQFLSGELSLNASIDDLSFINYYLQQTPWLTLDGTSQLLGRVILDHGRLATGTNLAFSEADITTRLGDYRAKGRGRIVGKVTQTAPSSADSTMVVQFEQVDIKHRLDKQTHFSSTDFRIAVSSEPLVIGGVIPPTTVELNQTDGVIPDFSLYNRYLPASGVEIHGGVGELSGTLSVSQQRIHGSLQLKGKQVALEIKDQPVVSDIELDIALNNDDLNKGLFDFSGSRIQLRNAAIAGDTPATGWSGEIRLRNGKLEWPGIANRFAPTGAHKAQTLQLPSGTILLDGKISDIGVFNPLLANGPRLAVHGPGSLNATMELKELGLAKGSRVVVDSQSISLTFLDYIANGQGQVQGLLGDTSEQQQITLTADINDASLQRQGDTNNHIEKLALSMRATGKIEEKTNALNGTQARIELEHGRVRDIRVYNNYLPHNSMAQLVSGQAQVNGWWELDARTGTGELTLNAKKVIAKIRDQLVTGELTLNGKLYSGDLKTKHFDIRGTELVLDNILVQEQTDNPWTGSLKIAAGKLRLSQPIEIDGALDLSMQDTRPFINLFGARDGKPKWLANLFNVKNIEGTTNIKLDKRDLTLTGLTLTGDKLLLQGHLRFSDKNLDGIAYVKYRKFGATVELKGKEREWHLVKPNKKFAAYPGLP